MCYAYTMEYYAAIKKNEMSFAATRIQLEIIILSVIKSEKNKHHMLSLILETNPTSIHEDAGLIPGLTCRNDHDTVNQLYINKTFKK
uniref:Uncharacterized protein n=1 Tax=Sus scrofa TaxID=9823 RepID=A0A8D0R607_PIG